MKRHIPSKTSIFIDVSPLGAKTRLLGYSSSKNLSFLGGGVEDGQTLLEALESECNDEGAATLDPLNFGNPAFNLNINIIHPIAYACLMAPGNKFIAKPKTYVGKSELKIVLRGQEVTGNKPYDCKELTKLGYYDYPFAGNLRLRTLVAKADEMRKLNWKESESCKLQPAVKVKFSKLRHWMLYCLHINSDFANKLVGQTTSKPPPEASQLRA